jgi:hypothetical protein
MSYTRVVDEDIDATKLRLNLRDHAPHVCGDRYISLSRHSTPSHPGDFATDCIRSVGSFAVVHSNMGTSPSQLDSDCGSDPAAATSHESNSIVQVFHGVIVCAGQH